MFTEKMTDPIGNPVIGSLKNIKKMNLKMVKDFHEENYLPENMVLVVCGKIDHDEICRIANENYPKFDDREKVTVNRSEFNPVRKYMKVPMERKFGVIGPKT